MECDFYSLEQAKDKLKTTTEYLIHKAAWNYDGKSMPIYILTAHFDNSSIHVDKDGAVDEYPINSNVNVNKLSLACLQELEAGNHDTEVSFERVPYYEWDLASISVDEPLSFLRKPAPVNGYWINGLRRRHMDYPLLYELRPRHLFNSTYPEPIKVSECKMVVLAEDLERLQQPEPSQVESKTKLNGHEERHAKNREEVLGAALAVLVAWPNDCKNGKGKVEGAKIAALIDEKALLFWRDSELPLKKDKIARIVNEWISKTI